MFLEPTSFMKEALLEAKKAFEEGEVPVGAVVVKNGRVIARGHNCRQKEHDISGHAEIVALKAAGKALQTWALDGCQLYVTLEPCLMCAGAIIQSRVSTLVYGASDPQFGAINSSYHVFDDAETLVSKGEMEQECKALLDEFFAKKRQK